MLKSIFSFIDFLDKNKENYISNCLPLIDSLNELNNKRDNLNPVLRYDDKIEFEKTQNELAIKSKQLEIEFTKPILDKLEKLGIWNSENRFSSIYENISKNINEIKELETDSEVKKIKEYALKYSKYRIETNTDFIFLTTCFDYFERGLFKIFDFFVGDSIEEYNEWKVQQENNKELGSITFKGKKVFINPTDNFERLRKHRDMLILNLFKSELEKRRTSGLNTTNEDELYIKKELLIIELATATNWYNKETIIQNKTELSKYINYLNIEIAKTQSSYLPTLQPETKTNELKSKLLNYGFFELSRVKQLSQPNQQRLIELINTNDLPFKIAMLDFLGFIHHLKTEYFQTNYKLFKAVAEMFEVNQRAVKGNINVLNEFSKENRERYTADKKQQIVEKNYEKLK